MTLGAGNLVFKLNVPWDSKDANKAVGDAIGRIRDFIYAMPDEGIEVNPKILANLLCPNESYVAYEVMEPANYGQERADGQPVTPENELHATAWVTTVTPKLKVLY